MERQTCPRGELIVRGSYGEFNKGARDSRYKCWSCRKLYLTGPVRSWDVVLPVLYLSKCTARYRVIVDGGGHASLKVNTPARVLIFPAGHSDS